MAPDPDPDWTKTLRAITAASGEPAVRLRVHASPGARSKSELRSYDQWRGALVVAVAAPAQEGKANQELCRFLAEIFGVSIRSVVVDEGYKSRDKVVRVEGLMFEAAAKRIEALLDLRR